MLKGKFFSPFESHSPQGNFGKRGMHEQFIPFSALILQKGEERIAKSFLDNRVGASISNGHLYGKCEDAGFVLCRGDGNIYLGVFDGVSGNRYGDFASRTFARETMRHISGGTPVGAALELSEAALCKTGKWKSAPQRRKPACTMLVAEIAPSGAAEITWLGDSFALALTDTNSSMKARQLTVPHEAFWNMRASETDSATITLGKADRLLLASDGLDFFSKKEIWLEAFSYNNMWWPANNLIKLAEDRSNTGNTGIREMKVRTDSFDNKSIGTPDDRIAIIYRHE